MPRVVPPLSSHSSIKTSGMDSALAGRPEVYVHSRCAYTERSPQYKMTGAKDASLTVLQNFLKDLPPIALPVTELAAHPISAPSQIRKGYNWGGERLFQICIN